MGQDEKEYQKLCLARYIFRKGIIDQYMQTKKITWREHWEETYGESYNDYVESVKK